jgi:hypothetical protein
MNNSPFTSFKTLQSGDPVRVIFSDATPDLDATFRRFADNGALAIVTTPIGVNDPAAQTVYYIDDYQQILSPIPV